MSLADRHGHDIRRDARRHDDRRPHRTVLRRDLDDVVRRDLQACGRRWG